jgi:hypothetical protein
MLRLDVCLLSGRGQHLDQLAIPPDIDSLRRLARRIEQLRELWPSYARGGEPTEERFQAGLTWALRPVYGSIALLERAGSYRAYDYVVAYVDRDDRAENKINPRSWDRILELAREQEALTLAAPETRPRAMRSEPVTSARLTLRLPIDGQAEPAREKTLLHDIQSSARSARRRPYSVRLPPARPCAVGVRIPRSRAASR